ncbi:transporter substrate-binding domain-containing protein [Geobacter pelophilus]|uniref:Transporter substrate-binding domain-containing protein n=1 Tax=Geoanaerobacter pelophilus TaxID=60036 RepID=A0AAW4L8S8_9BACT|nr:transporter substrate-binding domain-containing protein [Geoanaerobacter pelophilus]MBT0664716.1 transporter substrate-binding domain-containing protein [Geoanaerobacter pelophilus]
MLVGLRILRRVAVRSIYVMVTAVWIIIAIVPSPLGAAENRIIPDGCETVVYSTNPQYPPYDWSIGKSFDGASIELLKMVMPPGLPLKAAVYPWKRSMFLAEQGEIDLLVSLRITPERSAYLTFTSHRAFPNPIVVFVRKDRKFPYKSWKDLKNRKGGISAGDTFGGGFDEYWRKELSIEEAPTMFENYQKLDSGRIDYFVTSQYVGEAYLSKKPLSHEIIPLFPAISTLDIYFGFSKRSGCASLVDYVSKRLMEQDKKGVPEKLLKKHLKRYREMRIE